jgi:hypothetical protein
MIVIANGVKQSIDLPVNDGRRRVTKDYHATAVACHDALMSFVFLTTN